MAAKKPDGRSNTDRVFRCNVCRRVAKRHRSARRCMAGRCRGELVMLTSKQAPEPSGCCPTCGKPLNPSPKVCGQCGKVISNHHKWYFAGSIVYHRCCSDPTSYGTKHPAFLKGK